MRAAAMQAIGVVGVDMDDRDLEALGQVAGVEGRARLARASVVKPSWLLAMMWMRAAGAVAGQAARG